MSDRMMRPDEIVQAVIRRVRSARDPLLFRCDECGEERSLLSMTTEPDPWRNPAAPERSLALCPSCRLLVRARARSVQQVELEF